MEIPPVYPDPESIRELDAASSTTLNYQEEYCYKYDTMLIDGKTPQQFIGLEVEKQESGRQRIDYEEGSEGDNLGPMRIYVGVVMPKRTPGGNYTFHMCPPVGPCVPAGWLGVFCPACRYTEKKVGIAGFSRPR